MAKRILAVILVAIMALGLVGCGDKSVFNVSAEQLLDKAKDAGFNDAWVDTKTTEDAWGHQVINYMWLYFYNDEDKAYFSIDNRTGWHSLRNIQFNINNTDEIEKISTILTAVMPLYDKQFTYDDAKKIVTQLLEQEGTTAKGLETVHRNYELRIFDYTLMQDKNEETLSIRYNGNDNKNKNY